MLTDNSKALLERLETKYVTMLGMVRDIAAINMGREQEKIALEQAIFNQQREIHETANRLRGCK